MTLSSSSFVARRSRFDISFRRLRRDKHPGDPSTEPLRWRSRCSFRDVLVARLPAVAFRGFGFCDARDRNIQGGLSVRRVHPPTKSKRLRNIFESLFLIDCSIPFLALTIDRHEIFTTARKLVDINLPDLFRHNI